MVQAQAPEDDQRADDRRSARRIRAMVSVINGDYIEHLARV